jgi:hypothetical protein
MRLPVVDRTLGEALVVLVGIVLLLAKADRIAPRRCGKGIVGILLEVDLVGPDRQRALRDHHVAAQRSHALVEVDLDRLLGGEVDLLLAIGFLRVDVGRGEQHDDARECRTHRRTGNAVGDHRGDGC